MAPSTRHPQVPLVPSERVAARSCIITTVPPDASSRPRLHLPLEADGLCLRPPVASDAATLGAALLDTEMGVAQEPDPSVWPERVALWQTGTSPDGSADWLTWMVEVDDLVVGFVQATLTPDRHEAELAWALFPGARGRGLARRAVARIVAHATAAGVTSFVAHIAPGNDASERVARAVGLAPSERFVDGERAWRSAPWPP
jgi:RimJ/RimL family protein N-acetyltransferase